MNRTYIKGLNGANFMICQSRRTTALRALNLQAKSMIGGGNSVIVMNQARRWYQGGRPQAPMPPPPPPPPQFPGHQQYPGSMPPPPQQQFQAGFPGQQPQQQIPHQYYNPYPNMNATGMGMPPPPPPHHQQAPGPAGASAPNGEPAIGTKEKPMVVAPVPQPMSWFNRFWLVLIFFIGISAAINILEEVESRTSGGDSPAPKMGGGGMRNMFQSQEVKPVDLDKQQISFADVRGCDEAKAELEEIVQFLKNPKKFVALGGRLPKGALLVGPPGCGKTMLAKAIAKEADVKFFYAAGSEFDEMFVGVGSRRVRELFAAAKQNSPALIFIDEIDALGGKRSSKDHAYSRMTLNQLLSEMDGFQSNEEVIVIAATNTPDTLDKALTRPGRFDTSISVDPPDMHGREQIVEGYLEKIKKDASVKAIDIARSTSGFTGAELSHLINVAAIRAAILDKSAVTKDEIEYAKDRVMMGAENKTKIIPESERKITAWHEGGHALVALLLEKEGADPVHKATIIPRGSGVMGLVQQQPKDDRYSQSKKQMLNRLKVCLAGRVAEEILLGNDDVTSGASSDFQQATKIARHMVRRFGFNTELGVVDYESAETNEGAMISDETKQKIEQEVLKLVNDAHKSARSLLNENHSSLEKIANELLVYETLSGDELKQVIRGEPIVKPKPPPRPKKKDDSSNSKPPKGGPSGGMMMQLVEKATAKAEKKEGSTEPANHPSNGGGNE